tara:strand:+ start:313 stop:495 length:183 start_codon:yes stop_codon:yes gene_type:complete
LIIYKPNEISKITKIIIQAAKRKIKILKEGSSFNYFSSIAIIRAVVEPMFVTWCVVDFWF